MGKQGKRKKAGGQQQQRGGRGGTNFWHAEQKVAFDQLLARVERSVSRGRTVTGAIVGAIIEEECEKKTELHVIKNWPVSQKTLRDVPRCHPIRSRQRKDMRRMTK